MVDSHPLADKVFTQSLIYLLRLIRTAKCKSCGSLKLNIDCGKLKPLGWINIEMKSGA